MKLENNKATPSWKFSTQEGGTGTSNCLVITKRLKNKRETNRLISDLLLQLLVLVKFSLFFVVVFFGGVMGCGEQVTNWHYSIQSSFALHSLHELSRISLSVSLDSLLYYLCLRQSSITVHVRRSTHLLFMISWCTFHNPEGFAWRVPLSSIRCNKG